MNYNQKEFRFNFDHFLLLILIIENFLIMQESI